MGLDGVYTKGEYRRALRRNGYDAAAAAVQLKVKYEWRKEHGLVAGELTAATVQTELRKGYIRLLPTESGCSDYEGRPVVVFKHCLFFPSTSAAVATTTQAGGATDGTSSFAEIRKAVVYVLDLAVAAMEAAGADGMVVLADMTQSGRRNFDRDIDMQLVFTMKQHFPETVHSIQMIGGGKGMNMFLAGVLKTMSGQKSFMSDRTRQKVVTIEEGRESTLAALRRCLPLDSIPRVYGGNYDMPDPGAWVRRRAKAEGVDLGAAEGKALGRSDFMGAEAEALRGMQYAGCSVSAVNDGAVKVRGALFRKKDGGEDADSAAGKLKAFFGITWVPQYGVLRPDALLLYVEEELSVTHSIILHPVYTLYTPL